MRWLVGAAAKGVIGGIQGTAEGSARTQVFPGGLLALVSILRQTRTHLFPNTGLATMIADFLGPAATFADLVLPFAPRYEPDGYEPQHRPTMTLEVSAGASNAGSLATFAPGVPRPAHTLIIPGRARPRR